jgi:hypothetical protein
MELVVCRVCKCKSELSPCEKCRRKIKQEFIDAGFTKSVEGGTVVFSGPPVFVDLDDLDDSPEEDFDDSDGFDSPKAVAIDNKQEEHIPWHINCSLYFGVILALMVIEFILLGFGASFIAYVGAGSFIFLLYGAYGRLVFKERDEKRAG